MLNEYTNKFYELMTHKGTRDPDDILAFIYRSSMQDHIHQEMATCCMWKVDETHYILPSGGSLMVRRRLSSSTITKAYNKTSSSNS